MTSAAAALPASFVWRQSTITDYLRCARRVYLEHVLGLPREHAANGYAAPAGTAIHAVIAKVLSPSKITKQGQQAFATIEELGLAEITRLDIENALLDAFEEAVAKAQEQGDQHDPEQAAKAIDKLLTVQLAQVERFLADPRLAAIRWLSLEEEIAWTDSAGRSWRCGVDAIGVATRDVFDFAADGRERVDLHAHELVVVDWKSGEVELAHPARTASVQLGLYRMAVRARYGQEPRTFLAALKDMLPPSRPKDEHGESIPARLRTINPAWLEATGLSAEEAASSRKRPKDAAGQPITKWVEQDNPAWIEATSKPRGPLFHECRVDEAVVTETIRSVVRAAEAGLWPAGGAVTGECRRCPMRGVCVARREEEA